MLRSTISEVWGVLLEGRQILDRALIADEAIEEYRLKKKEVVLKLDFEKAYDHVDLDFFG